MSGDESVADLVRLMISKRVHRVAIGDLVKIRQIVTETDVIDLLARNVHLLEDATLSELKLGRSFVGCEFFFSFFFSLQFILLIII
jgi:CBS domain-containing protein